MISKETVINKYNFRDLGGLRTASSVTRSSFYVRSKSLTSLDDEFKLLLIEHNVKGVIDLRTLKEVSSNPDDTSYLKSQGIEYFSFPIKDMIHTERVDELNGSLFTDYKDILFHQREAIQDIFKLLASFSAGALLFHCNSGKDRTGVIAMLLLSLVGVKDEEIINDYTITDKNMATLFKLHPETFRVPFSSFVAHAKACDAKKTLDLIKELGGSAEYLANSNVCNQIKKKFIS